MDYAIITGASKGIGKEMAIALAKRKINLLLVARSENILSLLAEEIKHQYGINVFYIALDLAEPNADKVIYDWCMNNGISISILINNAGYGLWGNFDQLKLNEQQDMIRLNIGLPVDLTYRLLPLLKKDKPSFILNVASTASYQAVPTLTIYAATKSFLLSFSRGLRYELRETNVSVTCVSPGPVKTNFVNRAGMQAIKETADRFGMEASFVAETAIKAMLKGKAEVVPGFSNRFGVLLTRVLPKVIIESFIASIYRK